MKRRKRSHVQPVYGPNELLFTCEIFHEGTICMDNEKFTYIGGKREYYDYVDPDKISIVEFSAIAEELGHSKEISLWRTIPGKNQEFPRLLKSDSELLNLVAKIPEKNRVLECFLDHNNIVASCGDIVEGDNIVEVGDVDIGVEDYVNEGDKNIEVEKDGSVEGSDFFDSDNDVEPDDEDLTFDANVNVNIEGDFVKSTQIEDHPSEIENSDYAPSDELMSDCESLGEETNTRYPEFFAEIDMANPQFEVAMIFGSFKEFKQAIVEYAIKARRCISFAKNDKKRVKAVCKVGCPWTIWASHLNKESNLIHCLSNCQKLPSGYSSSAHFLSFQSISLSPSSHQIRNFGINYPLMEFSQIKGMDVRQR